MTLAVGLTKDIRCLIVELACEVEELDADFDFEH